MFDVVKISITTDASDNGQALSERVSGVVYAVLFSDGTFDDGVDAVITCETSDYSIPILSLANWNNDQVIYPRAPQSLASDGSALSTHTPPVAVGQIKIAIAQGGNAKSGSVSLFM